MRYYALGLLRKEASRQDPKKKNKIKNKRASRESKGKKDILEEKNRKAIPE